jgi:hypothetical protein
MIRVILESLRKEGKLLCRGTGRREFQKLASELVKRNEPAEIRTAISRAYYATHNVGAEILTGMGFEIVEGAGGHGDVWNRLSNSGDSEVMRVGSQLSNLHTTRIHADYWLNRKEVENQKTGQALVKQANRMIQILDEYYSEPKRTQIIKAIQDWEQKISGGKS